MKIIYAGNGDWIAEVLYFMQIENQLLSYAYKDKGRPLTWYVNYTPKRETLTHDIKPGKASKGRRNGKPRT